MSDGYENYLANIEERVSRKRQLESEIDEIKDSIIEIARNVVTPPIEAMNNMTAIIALGDRLVDLETEHATL